MNRKLLIVLFLLIPLISFARFGNSDNGSVNLSGNQTVSGVKTFSSSPIIPTPTNASQAVTKAYADQAAAGGKIVYYFSEDADAIPTYEKLVTTPVSVLASETITITSANYSLVDTWISAAGSPGVTQINDGIYTIHRHITKGNGADVQTARELWLRDGSTETFLATSTGSTINLTSEVTDDDSIVLNATSTTNTSRVVVKLYARKSGTGANPALTLWYGDGKQAWLNFSLPSSLVMLTDASNAATTSARTNLNVYSKTEGDARYAALNGSTTQTFAAKSLQINTTANERTIDIATTGATIRLQDGTANNSALDMAISGSAYSELQSYALGVGYDRPLLLQRLGGDLIVGGVDTGSEKLQVTGNASFSGDVRANSFTLGGNLLTNGQWLSGDGGNEGIQIDSNGEVLIATTTDAGDYKLQVDGNAYLYNTNTPLTLNCPSGNNSGMIFKNGGVEKWQINNLGGSSDLLAFYSSGATANVFTIANADGRAYFASDVSALSFTDRSAFPDSISDAYEIINSHEGKDGKLDHSKLSSKAWGTKSVQVGTIQKQITTQETKKIVEDGKEKEVTEDVVKTVEEAVYESQPDQSKRNLSMTISALCEVVKDQQKQIEELKKKLP